MDGIEHEIVGEWDMIIAHPPCTYLSNAGARWLFPNHKLNLDRYQKGVEAKNFFMMFWNANCKKIVIENPVPSKVFEMPEPTQIIQPYEYYGELHTYTKKTCLLERGVEKLVPINPVSPIGPYCPSGTSRKKRDKYGAAKRGEDAKNRSKTFEGIAQSFADQWG